MERIKVLIMKLSEMSFKMKVPLVSPCISSLSSHYLFFQNVS